MFNRCVFLLLMFVSTIEAFAQMAITIENEKVYQNGKVLFNCSGESLSDRQIYHVKNNAGSEEMTVILQNLEQPAGMQLLRAEFPLLGLYYEVQVQPVTITAVLQDMVNKQVFQQGKIVRDVLFPYLAAKRYNPRKLRPAP